MISKNIALLFLDACQTYDKRDAFLVKREGSYQPLSHRFARQRVLQFGRGLLALGLAPGEKVAILAETRLEWALADLGIICAGAVDVPIYPTLLPDQIAYILNNSEACGIVVSNGALLAQVQGLREQVPLLRFIIVMDSLKDLKADVMTMEQVEFLGNGRDNEFELEQRYQQIGREDLLTLIYTSGTTGHPKGVMLSHGNLLANIEGCAPHMPYGATDIALSHLPLSHVLERMAGYYCMLYRGVTIAYAESMQTVPENVREVRPTVLVSVPRLYEKIYAKVLANAQAGSMIKRTIFKLAMSVGKQAMPSFNQGKELAGFLGFKWNLADKLVYSKVKEATGGRLQYMLSGGAPLGREVAEFFLGMGMKIAEGYGLTETAPVLTVNRINRNKPGTVGCVIDNVEIAIAEDGEILARGPNIMLGYYKNPEATAEVMVDGWFHTGDIGVIDSEGFLRITDRKKDILVTSGGKNIAPQPMENALKVSPLIEQAVVIGDKHQFISALLVPPWETVEIWATRFNWPKDPEKLCRDAGFLAELRREVETQMRTFPRFQQVKKFRVIPRLLTIEHDELTPSLKIKRRNVLKNWAHLVDEIYAEL